MIALIILRKYLTSLFLRCITKRTQNSPRRTCCTFANNLKYEFVPEGYDVVTHGDNGDKFYICLHGVLGVYVPINKNKTQANMFENIDDDVKEAVATKFLKLKLLPKDIQSTFPFISFIANPN